MAVTRRSGKQQFLSCLQTLYPVKSPKPLMRLGSSHDGGYLLPDDLDGIKDLFSPGVQSNWTFEVDYCQRTNAIPHLIDCDNPPPDCPFPVTRGFLAGFGSPSQMGINEFLARGSRSNGDWFMQMDIEGGEYEVIAGMSQGNLARFRGLVIKMHNFQAIVDRNWMTFTLMPFLGKLSTQFAPVHVHPNNAVRPIRAYGMVIPRILEVTWWRRDRIADFSPVESLTNPLDEANVPSLSDVVLNWEFAVQEPIGSVRT